LCTTAPPAGYRAGHRSASAGRWNGSVFWYQQNNDNGSTLRRVSPMARLAYKWGSSMSLELEAGAENTTTRSDVADEKNSAPLLLARLPLGLLIASVRRFQAKESHADASHRVCSARRREFFCCGGFRGPSTSRTTRSRPSSTRTPVPRTGPSGVCTNRDSKDRALNVGLLATGDSAIGNSAIRRRAGGKVYSVTVGSADVLALALGGQARWFPGNGSLRSELTFSTRPTS